jgi:hypothetical protein
MRFAKTGPRLPDTSKNWQTVPPIMLDGLSSREEVIDYLESMRDRQPVADLAFTAYRDMRKAPWKPFLKAAFERNPVCIENAKEMEIDQVAEKLWRMPNDSIYDASRLAQPDEVWNFGRGDGLEKALCLMNIQKQRAPQHEVTIDGDKENVRVKSEDGAEYIFQTAKAVDLPAPDDFIMP